MRREKRQSYEKLFGPGSNNFEDRTETVPRPVRPILWDRPSRFGPVDRHPVGLCPSLEIVAENRFNYTNKNYIREE